MKRKPRKTGSPDKPSKTQLKREMLELQALGEKLIGLSDNDLAQLPVPPELLEAIHEARRMRKRGALYRQKQFIGKLMRDIDAEPIRAGLDRIQNRARLAAARFHTVERWRDRLLDEGDTALAKLLDEYPGADRQHLRRLIRDAIGERGRDAPPRAARQLFRYLDDLLQQAGTMP